MTRRVVASPPSDLHRHNARYVYLDGAFFGLGFSAFYPFTILPGFIHHFSNDPLLINLVSALFMFGLFGPQLVSCWLYDARPRTLPALLWWGVIYRMSVLFLVPLAWFSPQLGKMALPFFFTAYAVSTVAWGMGTALWQELLGRWLDDAHRSTTLGIRFFLEQFSLILGGFGVALVLERLLFPRNYAVVYAAGALCWWMCQLALSRTREVPSARVNPAAPPAVFLKTLWEHLKRDRLFRRLSLFMCMASSVSMSASLYTVFAFTRFFSDTSGSVRDGFAGRSSLFMTASVALGSLASGYLLRWIQTRWVLLISCGLAVAGAVAALLLHTPRAYLIVFIFNGLALGCFIIGSITIIFDSAPQHNRLRYIGTINSIRGVSAVFFTLAGGLISRTAGFEPTLILTALLSLLALPFVYGLGGKTTAGPGIDTADRE